MVLTNEELKEIYFGAYEFGETDDGYLQAFQYSKEQIKYFEGTIDMWYERCTASTAKTLEFTTCARKLAFDYKIIWKGSPDSFELIVDGLVTGIVYVKDIMDTGRIEWVLPEGKKNVIIYLPADATVLVRDFETDATVTRPAKNEKVLWLGDSITQGYGPLRSSCTYVSVANRILNYDIINQGIGGYVYDKNSLMKMEGYAPDKIIVALGTNQYKDEDMNAVVEYYERLADIYGEEIPIICITPLWRGDCGDDIETFILFGEKVKEIAGRYSNVSVIDGLKLVPHFNEYFLDTLHPNCLGCELYGRNLAAQIKGL